MRVSKELEARCLALAGLSGPLAVPPIAERISEKEFMSAVIELAKKNGWKVYHTFNSRKSEAGYPDLTLVRGNRLMFMELKREGETPDAAQISWLEALGETRAEVYWFQPSDWAKIVQLLA